MDITAIKRKVSLLPKWITIRLRFKKVINWKISDITKQNLETTNLDNRFQLDRVTYKDETWSYIKRLDEYRINMKKGIYLQFDDNFCTPKSKCKINSEKKEISVATLGRKNNWICFFSFDVSIEHSFTELQISFKYKDLGNRYRFMIRDNKEAVFEIVYNGEFYHRLIKLNYVLERGRIYKFMVIREDNTYLWYIDGNLIMGVQERKMMMKENKCGLILYNATDKCGIDCCIRNIELKSFWGAKCLIVINNLQFYIYQCMCQVRGEIRYA